MECSSQDEDQLSVYKIQSGNTLHMVKGVAKSSNPTATSSTPQRLPTMQAGQDPSDPLTQLNSHMAHGLMAGFNPFADLGLNTNDPNMVALVVISQP
jgi:ubiquilin